MRQRFSDALIGAYASAARSGVFDRPRAKRGFESAYLAYKGLAEAGPVAGLKRLVPAGATVIDVGANIGFFTVRFGRWVGTGGRVIAIEPELRNFHSLRRRVERSGLSEVVQCVHAAAADRPGELRLAITPDHPADHHLAAAGVPVRAVTLDELAADRPAPVALIKIDVQGAETLVLHGARRLIDVHRPAIFVEVDEPSLARSGSSAAELLDLIIARGYVAHRLGRRGPGPVDRRADLLHRVDSGYIDALLLPENHIAVTGG
jgi:FkbM family methyltransferase